MLWEAVTGPDHATLEEATMATDEPTAERWLPVAGYEGLYEVSDLGRVRVLEGQSHN
jgi:NUMOD4 motif